MQSSLTAALRTAILTKKQYVDVKPLKRRSMPACSLTIEPASCYGQIAHELVAIKTQLRAIQQASSREIQELETQLLTMAPHLMGFINASKTKVIVSGEYQFRTRRAIRTKRMTLKLFQTDVLANLMPTEGSQTELPLSNETLGLLLKDLTRQRDSLVESADVVAMRAVSKPP